MLPGSGSPLIDAVELQPAPPPVIPPTSTG
jgi:hypothetical protein